jgi:hypothetical protein
MELLEAFDAVSQVGVVIFGSAAIILGLCSQPFFLFTTWYNWQPGVLILALWYTTQWTKGIKNYWLDGGERFENFKEKIRSNRTAQILTFGLSKRIK